ncbi:MAG TPA: hypothetical protein VHD87_02745 [Acidimicrobiales bacterium]|nr:hypothetical protein [Acidimicrobiales bacterium]
MGRRIWSYGDPWADFAPLLGGETPGPVTFVTRNATAYTIHAAEGWWRRATDWHDNAWPTDGLRRPLLAVIGATACGLALRWAAEPWAFAVTTPVAAVCVGEHADADAATALPAHDDWDAPGHPDEACAFPYCPHRLANIRDGLRDHSSRD